MRQLSVQTDSNEVREGRVFICLSFVFAPCDFLFVVLLRSQEFTLILVTIYTESGLSYGEGFSVAYLEVIVLSSDGVSAQVPVVPTPDRC